MGRGLEKERAEAAFEKIFLTIGGGSAIINVLSGTDRSKLAPEVARRLDVDTAQMTEIQKRLAALSMLPDTALRDDRVLPLVVQAAGLLGAMRWIEEEQQAVQQNETQASFDSELSLLYWPDYPLSRWQPNYLHYASPPPPDRRTTLMVARLAAPKPELVLRMIDTSIAVEESGLTGVVYLDARGLPHDPREWRRTATLSTISRFATWRSG